MILSLILLLISSWGTLALFYTIHVDELLQYTTASLFAVISFMTLVSLIIRRYRLALLTLYGLSWTALFIWYSTILPSHERRWQEDVALLPYAKVRENNVTFYNIRNFHYRSEYDFTPDYYDQSFDLDKISGVDLIAVYWMGPAVAHIFISFSFEDGRHLAISIETRKEQNEAYSTLKGFFRQYELIYVVADERDLIGLRTNYRFDPTEDLYIYPLAVTHQGAKKLFLNYIENINTLYTSPEFYNTLTTNCTTTIWQNAESNTDRLPMSWKILLSGYVPEYLYEHNRLKSEGLSFETLKEQAHVNQRALELGIIDDFSQQIRKE